MHCFFKQPRIFMRLALFLSVIIMSGVFAEAPLFRDGFPQAFVELSEDAAPPLQLAKREIEKYFLKAASANSLGSTTSIRLGQAQDCPQLATALRDKLNAAVNDAFAIEIKDNHITIAGNSDQATLFAAYAFLEKYLGVRWFYPGEMGEHVPALKELTLKNDAIFEEGGIRYRQFSVCGTSTDFVSTIDWMTRNRMLVPGYQWMLNSSGMPKEKQAQYLAERSPFAAVGGHEGARRIVSSKKYFADHPEYFALKNGKRVYEGRVNPCLSNAMVQELIANSFIEAIKKNPATIVDFIGEDAPDAFCECDDCKKLGTYNGKHSYSTLHHRFFSIIAERILKQYPDAHLRFWAYMNYREVPEDPAIQYRSKNSILYLCTHQKCYVHEFDKKNICNRKQVELLEQWSTRADRFGIYDYRFDASTFYAPFEYVLADDIKRFAKANVVLWSDEIHTAYGAPPRPDRAHAERRFISCWQTTYSAAKMLWNPSLDIEALMDEAYDLYYGSAAPIMKSYHAYRRQLWETSPGHAVYPAGRSRSAYCLNTPRAYEKLQNFLREAKITAKGNELLEKRIAQDGEFLDIFWKEPYDELQKLLAERKDLLPQKCVDSIVIDGQFNEKTWLMAEPSSGFLRDSDKHPSLEPTNVRIAYDSEFLYFAINAENKAAWSEPTAKIKTADGPLWEEDSIEIQIVPELDGDVFYHLIVNTLGTLYDAKCIGNNFDKAWSSNAEIKVFKEGTCWNYEIKVPQKSFATTITPGQAWKFHFIRTITNLQPPVAREWSSMDGVRPHSPQEFRTAVFASNYIRNGNFAQMGTFAVDKEKSIPFPKHWELAGSALTKNQVTATAKGNQVWFNGVLMAGFATPKEYPENSEYVFSVRVKGTGTISASTWSWEGYQPRLNQRRLKLAGQALAADFQSLTFRVPWLPAESYFIFYLHSKDATVEQVTCTVQSGE